MSEARTGDACIAKSMKKYKKKCLENVQNKRGGA
jgi:hypothetical protein